MKPDCRNDCVEPVRFPRRPNNRPGLSRIAYRIASYSGFREALFRQLDKDAVLNQWTHRGADDPGIALLEGVAILGDILTFYQELYANEAYLRTAQWRESIADLVRLLGYRLAPGLGGKGELAFGIKGDKPVIIPAAFAAKAQVGTAEKQLDFETDESTTAYPHLSRFHLYRPRLAPASIEAGQNRLEIDTVGGARDLASIAALDLKKGDRLMLVPEATMFDVTGTAYSAQDSAEILIVSKVETVLDRRIVEFEGALIANRGSTVKAYKLGRSFRHFGHNAPAFVTSFDSTAQKTTLTATSFTRQIYTDTDGGTYYPALPKTAMPLDQSVNDLAVGASLIAQGTTQFDDVDSPVPFVVVKQIRAVAAASLVWGNLTGAATMVSVNAKLVANDDIQHEESDIRQIQFHETKSPEIVLRALSSWNSGAFSDTKLSYFGTYADAVKLADRSLILADAAGSSVSLEVTSQASDFSLAGKDEVNSWMWPITLGAKPKPFGLDDFDEAKPTVAVHGNVVPVSQGKSERPAVLGNGDSRQSFQTFKLPKAPLTYLDDAAQTPPEVPELRVYVNDRLWSRVSSLFGRGPTEEIYIVREDADGNSWVQFGDGKTGARLPSGMGNVSARYRSGNGAFGPLKADTSVQPGGKLDRLDKIWLPGVISGGEKAEDGANARDAAPGKVQSLDRLVSLRDFECETLTIGGVSKAAAAWQLMSGVPAVVVTVLMDSGRAAEIADVQSNLNLSNRCRGPQRFPVIVHQGARTYVYVEASYALLPTFLEEIVSADIRAALGAANQAAADLEVPAGLFTLGQRTFGEREYATRIAGAIQNVQGVGWAKVTAFGAMLGSGDDPTKLSLPSAPLPLSAIVACGADRILALHAAHLHLSVSSAPSAQEC